jgi:Tfp pilus assembly protein PilO
MYFLSVLTKVDRILTIKSLSLVPEVVNKLRDNESPYIRMSAEIIGYRYNAEGKKQ